MVDLRLGPLNDRARAGWWAFVLVLAAAAAFIAYSFVEVLALGLFGYYAARPIDRWFDHRIDSDSVAAWITLGLIIVPVVALAAYAVFKVFQNAQQFLGNAESVPIIGQYLSTLPEQQRTLVQSLLQSPSQILSGSQQAFPALLQVLAGAANMLLILALGLGLSYFLLVRDDALTRGLVELFGGRDTTAYAYAAAVDEDLETVFFGNFLFVIIMAGIAAVTYFATNVVAPEGLHIPMILTLAFLTGVASLVPIVVGKIIYVPIVGYLALQATRTGGAALAFVGGVLVVYFLVLDILPQTFIQPYITGRELDMMVLMFAYLLGPMLFGWYGFFLLPIIFILMLETVRIVLSELIHGERITSDVSMGWDIGTDPQMARRTAESGDDGDSGESGPDDASGASDA
jgi:predicted PurR-regulated permease PerM